MAGVNWKCNFCQHPQVVTDHNFDAPTGRISVGDNARGERLGYGVTAVACQNPDCRLVTLKFDLTANGLWNGNDWSSSNIIDHWELLPASHAKPQPDYIPAVLRDDYNEACAIRDLSPKASATLARRCLQGMIRDFAGIAKGTLDAEIRALQDLVDQDKAPRGVSIESVEAIDHARKIGNIGAHMEKDINTIVDIDPDEAQILIDLVETLFDEWYVSREERAKRFKGIAVLRAKKDAEKPAKPSRKSPQAYVRLPVGHNPRCRRPDHIRRSAF